MKNVFAVVGMAFASLALGQFGWDDGMVVPTGVFCSQIGSLFSLERGDGAAIGDALAQNECESAALVAREGVVCARWGGGWYPTIAASTKKLGNPISFEDCQSVVRSAHAGMVCSHTESSSRPWRPTHTVSAFAYGRYGTSLGDCLELTRNASVGVVCTNTGTYNFRGRKPTVVNDKAWTDSNLLGASGQQEFCTKATRESQNAKVCACNGDFCGADSWILYDLPSRKAVGSTSSLDSCIQAQGR
jgi:hypothetical protein